GVAGRPFADEAEHERRNLAPRLEHLRHEPMAGERGDQLPVHLPGLAAVGDRRENVSSKRLALCQQFAVRGGQMRVGGAHLMTATPTSSTIASGSKSSVTPSTAIAG